MTLRVERTRRREDHLCMNVRVEDHLGLYAHTEHQSELWHFLGVLPIGPMRYTNMGSLGIRIPFGYL